VGFIIHYSAVSRRKKARNESNFDDHNSVFQYRREYMLRETSSDTKRKRRSEARSRNDVNCESVMTWGIQKSGHGKCQTISKRS
jgi:hypothetical protein